VEIVDRTNQRRYTAEMLVYAVAAVARGVELLDEAGPAGWREVIDLGLLNLSSGRLCVLGQLYGSYQDGLQELDVERAHDLGFVCGHWSICYCDHLTELWRERLTGGDADA
jgi:hypothetical protein